MAATLKSWMNWAYVEVSICITVLVWQTSSHLLNLAVQVTDRTQLWIEDVVAALHTNSSEGYLEVDEVGQGDRVGADGLE